MSISLILSGLFPLTCLGCGREGVTLCSECLARIPREAAGDCPRCDAVSPYGDLCTSCQRQSSLDHLLYGTLYHPVIREALHRLKYEGATALAKPLATILAARLRVFLETHSLDDEIAIVPVPLFWWREKERGFNQALVLARALGERVHLPVVSELLKKERATTTQTKLTRKERLANLADVFSVRSGMTVPATVILLDDIFTTAATLTAAARTLRHAGVKTIIGLTVAKG
ncbi:MAG: ComF family protein [Parcubacteria group bacterium]|nr:ComF family protein [Parcubacteria group bacterium]